MRRAAASALAATCETDFGDVDDTRDVPKSLPAVLDALDVPEADESSREHAKGLDLQVDLKDYPLPMGSAIRIADVAERSGFSAATLRYYEKVGIVPPPPRTAAGYRSYDESILDRLAFVTRAKALGCSLEEIAELMPHWDEGRCAPVQERLRDLVALKLDDAHGRAADLANFTADLRRIQASLGAHTPEGACHGHCGCLTDTIGPTLLRLAPAPVACALDSADLPERLRHWNGLLGHVIGRETIDGGLRLHLDAAAPLDQLVLLVRDEQACCSFFAFAITVDGRGLALEVRAPPEAEVFLGTLFATVA